MGSHFRYVLEARWTGVRTGPREVNTHLGVATPCLGGIKNLARLLDK